MPYTKILVPLDLSPKSETVFQEALSLAKQNGAALMLFHGITDEDAYVVELENIPVAGEEPVILMSTKEERLAKYKQQIEEKLSAYGKQATDQGITTQWEYGTGDPGPDIQKLANSWGADLITISRQKRSNLAEIFWGSVSSYVIHNLHCAILIVP